MRKLTKERTGIVVLGVLAVVVGLATGFVPTEDAAVLARMAFVWRG